MNGTVFLSMIEQALLQVHTGFVGRVVSVSDGLASIQPLNMIQETGGLPKQQAVIPGCPILQNAKKFVKKEFRTTTAGDPSHSHTATVWDLAEIVPGDIVYCVCADRDISETRTGTFAAPVAGHHSLSGAVVVGILVGEGGSN